MSDQIVLNEDHIARLRAESERLQDERAKADEIARLRKEVDELEARKQADIDVEDFIATATVEQAKRAMKLANTMMGTGVFNRIECFKGMPFPGVRSGEYQEAWIRRSAEVLSRYYDSIFLDFPA
jgi:hypothetical protein